MMPNTVNKYVTCFRKLCNLAAEEGYNTNAVSLKVWKERTVKEEETRIQDLVSSALRKRKRETLSMYQ